MDESFDLVLARTPFSARMHSSSGHEPDLAHPPRRPGFTIPMPRRVRRSRFAPIPQAPEGARPVTGTDLDALPLEPAVDLWQEHKQKILVAGIAVTTVAAVAVGLYTWSSTRAINAAKAYTAAQSEFDLIKVTEKYRGSTAAGNAMLELAALHEQKGDPAKAESVLKESLKRQPSHPFAGGAELKLAGLAESRGKVDEALTLYQGVSDRHPKSYAAPLALLARAALLARLGRTAEAIKAYENLVQARPDTPQANEAKAELDILRRRLESAEASPGALPIEEPQAKPPAPVPAAAPAAKPASATAPAPQPTAPVPAAKAAPAPQPAPSVKPGKPAER